MTQSYKTVQQLVANFKANEAAYLANNYSESQVRQDFIDKFFTALGWDVTHTTQFNPYEQEVKIENRVTMPGTQRRADYAFYVKPNYRDVKFFTEAKKPSRNLSNADDYYQAIRYAWNANTPIAVLTDFEEFHILDCRYKPDINDSLNRKLKQYHYSHYVDEEKFKEIFFLFGREAVANGSLEKYAADLPKPRGKAIQGSLFKGGYKSVDEAFLEQLDEYRNTLAKAFKKENQDLGGEELTEAVQRTIDRLVFIRFLEDKGIEEPQIIGLHENKSAWNSFLAICKRFEPKYNGLIFKPHRILDGNKFNPPDDRDFADICGELADPTSPYDFDKIPISILGSIYERFLGKVVHATAKRVEVQEKPEVRKAGGVYYTPEYIVRYIVNETVGRMIDNKTPDEIAKMSFADIACGSGSFLIEVYSVLLQYHDRWYNVNKEKAKKDDVFEKDGYLHLSLKKKKEILTNNLYGVDIDFQATEVTQLSLYLKLLENVSMNETFQIGLFKETILPNLNNNIVCGNSLIGTDIGGLFESEETEKIKAMDYNDVFPIIMKRGGFDAVVGNPPYGASLDKSSTLYLRQNYKSIPTEVDTYTLFIEKSISVLKNRGCLSLIVPTGWYSGSKFSGIRRFFCSETDPLVFINLPYDIFKAWVDTTIFIAEKRLTPTDWQRNDNLNVLIKTFPKRHKIESIQEYSEGINYVNIKDWFDSTHDEFLTYADNNSTSLIKKIDALSKPLCEFADVQRGVTPFSLTDTPTHKTSKQAFNGTVRRYDFQKGLTQFIRFDDSLAEPKPEKYFIGERILLRELISRQFQLQAVFVKDDFITNKSMQSILPIKNGPHLYFILGLINSKLLSWYFLKHSNVGQRDDFPKIVLRETRNLPIRKINISDAQEKKQYDNILKYVGQMLEAKQKLSAAKIDVEVNRLELHCASLDRKIDEAVYELYGLTGAEIKIVEGA